MRHVEAIDQVYAIIYSMRDIFATTQHWVQFLLCPKQNYECPFTHYVVNMTSILWTVPNVIIELIWFQLFICSTEGNDVALVLIIWQVSRLDTAGKPVLYYVMFNIVFSVHINGEKKIKYYKMILYLQSTSINDSITSVNGIVAPGKNDTIQQKHLAFSPRMVRP